MIVKTKEMQNKIGLKNYIGVFPNGVNLSAFYPINKIQARIELNLDESKNVVLFASDPKTAAKNYQLASEACKNFQNVLLLPVYNENQARLFLYYNAADILLLTSFQEGGVNVIKEAMACGCPIVSTNVGDVKWVIGNTEGCYLTSFNLDDVAEKIKLALKFNEKTERTKGRERIVELGLDSETVARKIIDVYKNVLLAK